MMMSQLSHFYAKTKYPRYGSKLVALATMLSSVTFYNNIRYVNQMEIEFLADVVLFDEVFRDQIRLPLMSSRALGVHVTARKFLGVFRVY